MQTMCLNENFCCLKNNFYKMFLFLQSQPSDLNVSDIPKTNYNNCNNDNKCDNDNKFVVNHFARLRKLSYPIIGGPLGLYSFIAMFHLFYGEFQTMEFGPILLHIFIFMCMNEQGNAMSERRNKCNFLKLVLTIF